MKTTALRFSTLYIVRVLTLVLTGAAPLAAMAQGACSSDGQPQPVALLERFINADCESCWRDPASTTAKPGQLVLDWVLPGLRGDDAPLSAVATRDSLKRVQSLAMAVPVESAVQLRKAGRLPGTRLRVAHGPVINAYLGASMALKPRPRNFETQGWTGWLAVVERIPKGVEGSPVARNLVRNTLQIDWRGQPASQEAAQNRFFESRVMGVPHGANPELLSVVGWLEDPQGQIVAAMQSRCLATEK
ncbi:MAG: hypothetical protein V4625_01590 [Pseudomonadota bacterium]